MSTAARDYLLMQKRLNGGLCVFLAVADPPYAERVNDRMSVVIVASFSIIAHLPECHNTGGSVVRMDDTVQCQWPSYLLAALISDLTVPCLP